MHHIIQTAGKHCKILYKNFHRKSLKKFGKKNGEGGAHQASGRTLPPGVVDGILPGENDLGDGHEGIALLEEGLEDSGQGLRRMEGGVVEQDDGARLNLGGHPLDNLPGGQVLPVQAVPAGSACKEGFYDWKDIFAALLFFALSPVRNQIRADGGQRKVLIGLKHMYLFKTILMFQNIGNRLTERILPSDNNRRLRTYL